ncbi:hypothetical protein [Pseudomonas syringae]|uniref:hypothetical protein n=1 Tax=Pseudomonas syringae TaxID=317 RepID=UPI000465C0C2|nr:hypothetical protein [Pseudomonas syringae]
MNLEKFCQAAKDMDSGGKVLLITGHACDKFFVRGLIAHLEIDGLQVEHRVDERRVIDPTQAIVMSANAGPRNRWGILT